MNENISGNFQKTKHTVFIDGRSSAEITGVEYLNDFDSQKISLSCSKGALIIEGEELHITKLSLERGELSVVGNIYALIYEDENMKPQGGFFTKLFGRQ